MGAAVSEPRMDGPEHPDEHRNSAEWSRFHASIGPLGGVAMHGGMTSRSPTFPK